MAHNSFMDNIRTFFGLGSNPPRTEFRNPIWSSDDEDDGDELYTRQHNIDIFENTLNGNHEFKQQMEDMMKVFGTMFGEFKTFFQDDKMNSFTTMIPPEDPDMSTYNGKSIRDYYLKPGYHSNNNQPKEDIDLDGKVSSHEISGLLNQNRGHNNPAPITPFNGMIVPGRSYCQTVITTSITKPDGTVETRRIVKSGNDVLEDSTTSSGPDTRGPPGLNHISSSGIIMNNVMSELASLFRNFY